MSFHDGGDNSEAHPEPLFLGSDKLFEYPVAQVRRNPSAAILHGHTDSSVAVRLRADSHFSLRLRNVTHGVEGIADQIDQDLLNLDRVSFDRRQVAGQ